MEVTTQGLKWKKLLLIKTAFFVHFFIRPKNELRVIYTLAVYELSFVTYYCAEQIAFWRSRRRFK